LQNFLAELSLPPILFGTSFTYPNMLNRLASGEKRWNGPGRDMPTVLQSDGKVSVTLTKHAFLIVSLLPEA